ncbi:hypothetical protein GE21DRAFT_1313514 [Neurospora crassa]|nr:hypothetical protein GE21DRAFT_1313514 [Neurospora crassa]
MDIVFAIVDNLPSSTQITVAIMKSTAVPNSDREVPAMSDLRVAAEKPPAVLVNSDKHVSTHEENGMATNGASIDRLTNDVIGFHIGDEAATKITVVENPSPRAERSPAENQFGTLGTLANSSQAPNDISNSALSKQSHINHAEGKKLDVKPTSTAVTSTEPVGIYYPPRRPNIFRARAKHLRFPECDRNPIPSHAVDKSEGFMEDVDDDLSFEGLEEFQSESKRKMAEKTKRFMGVVQQCEWRSRVEDLGTVQEIEETLQQIRFGCSWLFRILKTVRVGTVAKSRSVVWCSSNVATKPSDVARNSSPVASRPEEDINVEPLHLPLSKISSSLISQRGSQFAPAPAPAPAPTLLHTCTETSHRAPIFQPTHSTPPRPTPRLPHCRRYRTDIVAKPNNDLDMLRALQYHRAMARASEQQEATIEAPIHHPYQQGEAQPFRRATLRDCFPQVKKPTEFSEPITINNPNTNNTFNKDIAETDRKNASSIVEPSNLGPNDLIAPLTSSMSQLKISPTPTRSGDNYQASWLTASPFSTNGSASKPRLSRREQKKLESRKWANNAFIDGKGRLDTKMNRLGKMRKRLRHRCTWVKKPFSLREFVHRAEQPVPFLVLTDPEGGITAATTSDPKSFVRASTMARSTTNLGITPPAENEAVILFNYGTPARIDKSNHRNNNIYTNENIPSRMGSTDRPHDGANTSTVDKRETPELRQAGGLSGAYDHRHLNGSLATGWARDSPTDDRSDTPDTNHFDVSSETTGAEPLEREDSSTTDEEGGLGKMTTREYSEFINWRVASLMSPETSGPEPITETEAQNLEDSSNHDLDPVASKRHDITDDTEDDENFSVEEYTGEDEGDDWLLDSLTEEDLEYFTVEDFREIYSAREDHLSQKTETLLLQGFPPPRKQPSSRRHREPKTPKWKDHSLADEDGFLSTRQRKRQEEGRRLRGQCNWLRVPSLAVSTDSSVPDLIMTSPEGRSYSLHDPMDYE